MVWLKLRREVEKCIIMTEYVILLDQLMVAHTRVSFTTFKS